MKRVVDSVFIKFSLLFVASLFLLACQLAATTEPKPARLVSSNQNSSSSGLTRNQPIDHAIKQTVLNEIKAAVRQSLNGAKVTLAKQFLVTSSWLIIEPSRPLTLSNPQPLGRSYDAPIKFQLFKSDGQCFIQQSGKKKRWLLKKAKCQFEK